MTDVGFYHLQKWPLERALPRLLEKVLARGLRAVVRTGTEARLEHLDDLLWTYDEAAFLPHGTSADGHAGRQPVWLTLADEAPNGATVLVLVDGVDPGDLSRFDRVVAMDPGVARRLRSEHDGLEARLVTWTISDPYGGAPADYRYCLEQIDAALPRLRTD